MSRKSIRVLLTLCIALFSVAAFNASAAFAGTISMSGLTISYSGTGNSVDANYNGLAYTFSDVSSTAMTAGTGCTQYSSSQVNCATSVANQLTVPAVSAGSGIPSTTRLTTPACYFNGTTDPGPITVNCDSTGAAYDAGLNIYTGSGGDQITAGPNYAGTVLAGAGDDMITVNTDHTFAECDPVEFGCVDISGESGDDVIDASASTGDVYYDASAGDDYFQGGSGADHIVVGYGATGSDTLYGGAGNDIFYDYAVGGNDGDDYVYGGAGNDKLTLTPNSTTDGSYEDGVHYQGGTGTDWFGYDTGFTGAEDTQVSLDGVANDGPVSGGSLVRGAENVALSVENIGSGFFSTSSGNDTYTGSSDNNLIHGWNGNDTITGNAGSDTLYGDGGNDTIYATDGQTDTVYCGTGSSDVVDADTADTVNADCESVTRH